MQDSKSTATRVVEAIVCDISTGGNVNEEVNAAAVLKFEDILTQHLIESNIELQTELIKPVAKRVIGHLTVTPAMQVLVEHDVRD